MRFSRGLVLFVGSERCLLLHPDSPNHRWFLRFAFNGVVYQLYGLSLAPRTFTKFMDAAFSPLRQMGVRILNYLDDWLTLVQSEDELIAHSHLEGLGLRINLAKSFLFPSQQTSFLRAVFESVHMRAVVVPDCAPAIQQLVSSFRYWASYPLRAFQKMLGLMTSATPVLQLGLLRMRPFQYWLKPLIPPHSWRHGSICIRVRQACIAALAPWKDPQWFEQGVKMGLVYIRKVVSTDTSNTGWGALCEGNQTFGSWLKAEGWQHINCLEMIAVCWALQTFLLDLRGHHVVVRSDSMMVVSYMNHQGRLTSKHLFKMVRCLLECAHLNLHSLRATHVPSVLNQGADMLSRSNVPSEEWMLHP